MHGDHDGAVSVPVVRGDLRLAVVAAGCTKTIKESLPGGFKQTGQRPAKVYPLAGKVTIDGQLPHVVWPDLLLVMLTNPSNPILTNRPCRQCSQAGAFTFGTNTKDDGFHRASILSPSPSCGSHREESSGRINSKTCTTIPTRTSKFRNSTSITKRRENVTTSSISSLPAKRGTRVPAEGGHGLRTVGK